MTIIAWVQLVILIIVIILSLAVFIFSFVRMRREGLTRKWVPYLISVLGLLLITYLAYNTVKISPADWAQILLMLSLVVVTGIYAFSTVKMAEEMKEQRYDAVRPVVDIKREGHGDELVAEGLDSNAGDTSKGLSCTLQNIGLGPALDVQSLVQPPLPPWGKPQSHSFGTIAIGGEDRINLSLQQEDGRTALVVRYRDVYGRAFESSREVSPRGESKGWEIGPLKIVPIQEVTGHDQRSN